MSNKVKQYIILNTSRKHGNYEEARKVSLEIFDKSRPK
jgi:hypothetical protein